MPKCSAGHARTHALKECNIEQTIGYHPPYPLRFSATIGSRQFWGFTLMIPEYDIFRIDDNGLTWLGPAENLDGR